MVWTCLNIYMIETDRDYRKQLTSCDMRFDICAVGLKRLVARHIMLLCPVILSPFVMSLPLFHFAALLTWIAPVENRPPGKCDIRTNAVHTNSFRVNRLTIWPYDLVRVRGTKKQSNNPTRRYCRYCIIVIASTRQARAQIKFQQLGGHFFQHMKRMGRGSPGPAFRRHAKAVLAYVLQLSYADADVRMVRLAEGSKQDDTRGKTKICESAHVWGFHFVPQRKLSQKPNFVFLVKGPINLSKLPRFEKTHLLDLYASAWSLKKTTLEMENLDAICPPRCMMIELGNANSTCWGTNQDCLWLCTGLTDVLCFVRHFCYKERSCDPGVKVQDELGRQELKTVY